MFVVGRLEMGTLGEDEGSEEAVAVVVLCTVSFVDGTGSIDGVDKESGMTMVGFDTAEDVTGFGVI